MNPTLFVLFQGTRAKQRRFPGNDNPKIRTPLPALFFFLERRGGQVARTTARSETSHQGTLCTLHFEMLWAFWKFPSSFFLLQKKLSRFEGARTSLSWKKLISVLNQPTNQPNTTIAPFLKGTKSLFPTKSIHPSVHCPLRPPRLRWLPCNFPRPRNLGNDATRSPGVRGLGWKGLKMLNMEGQKCL